MSETTTTCSPIVNLDTILQPLIMSSIFKEEGSIDIGKIVEMKISVDMMYQIVNSILGSVTDENMKNLVCVTAQAEEIKAVSAILRGEETEFDISKVIEMAVNIQMMEQMSSAFGGGTTTSS